MAINDMGQAGERAGFSFGREHGYDCWQRDLCMINRETGEKVFLECKHKDHTVVFGDRREDGSCWIGTGLDRRQLLPMFDCIDNFEVNGMLYFLIRETRMEYWLYIDDFGGKDFIQSLPIPCRTGDVRISKNNGRPLVLFDIDKIRSNQLTLQEYDNRIREWGTDKYDATTIVSHALELEGKYTHDKLKIRDIGNGLMNLTATYKREKFIDKQVPIDLVIGIIHDKLESCDFCWDKVIDSLGYERRIKEYIKNQMVDTDPPEYLNK